MILQASSKKNDCSDLFGHVQNEGPKANNRKSSSLLWHVFCVCTEDGATKFRPQHPQNVFEGYVKLFEGEVGSGGSPLSCRKNYFGVG